MSDISTMSEQEIIDILVSHEQSVKTPHILIAMFLVNMQRIAIAAEEGTRAMQEIVSRLDEMDRAELDLH
jgi:hypothetical protein